MTVREFLKKIKIPYIAILVIIVLSALAYAILVEDSWNIFFAVLFGLPIIMPMVILFVASIFVLFLKKQINVEPAQTEVLRYKTKSREVEAYHFTRTAFSKSSMPLWLKEATSKNIIRLWSQHGGDVIAGEIETPKLRQDIKENDYIVRVGETTFIVVSQEDFEKDHELI
jgi:uncharacterized membrane protein